MCLRSFKLVGVFLLAGFLGAHLPQYWQELLVPGTGIISSWYWDQYLYDRSYVQRHLSTGPMYIDECTCQMENSRSSVVESNMVLGIRSHRLGRMYSTFFQNDAK